MGSSGGGDSGGSSEQTNTIRYAPYIESFHSSFLNSVRSYRNAIIGESPYSAYVDIEVEDAFFGAGYIVSSFPSLYDMFGKFMAGLDVDSLYSQIFTDTLESSEVNDLVSAEAALIEDDIDENLLPRLQTGMRDINSVMSSSFIIGKSLLEDSRLKTVEKFRAELKYRLIPVVSERWKAHLEWNKNVVNLYAEIMKLYYAVKMDVDEANYSFSAKNRLWPFTILDYERLAIGVLQGAMTTSSEVQGSSSKSKSAIGGALSGAGAGYMFGGLPGAAIGGVLGLGASFL